MDTKYSFFKKAKDLPQESLSTDGEAVQNLTTTRCNFNIHKRIPLEVRLEIFAYLTNKEWTRLAEHNRRTKRV
jgi:hypothetical protein